MAFARVPFAVALVNLVLSVVLVLQFNIFFNYALAHDVSGKCGGLQMSDPRNYGQYIYQPYVGDTDWAACFVAPNQNAAESDLQCPHSFLKIEDHNRDCKDLFDNSPQRRTLKRVCCLIQPHATTEVKCRILAGLFFSQRNGGYRGGILDRI